MSLFVISLFIILKIYNSFILLTEILKGLDLQESLILALEYKVKYFGLFFFYLILCYSILIVQSWNVFFFFEYECALLVTMDSIDNI
jgi:hypothetical protein